MSTACGASRAGRCTSASTAWASISRRRRPTAPAGATSTGRCSSSRGEQRQVVLLVGLEGLTYAETAEVLAIPVGTVMSRLARGRGRLRTLMGYEGGGKGGHAALRRVK